MPKSNASFKEILGDSHLSTPGILCESGYSTEPEQSMFYAFLCSPAEADIVSPTQLLWLSCTAAFHGHPVENVTSHKGGKLGGKLHTRGLVATYAARSMDTTFPKIC